MEDAKTAQKIGHDPEKSEKFIEPRVRPFQHHLVGALGRSGGSRLGRRGRLDAGRRLFHMDRLPRWTLLHNREIVFRRFRPRRPAVCSASLTKVSGARAAAEGSWAR